MIIFYWVMGLLIVGTFAPAVFFLLVYAVTGDDRAAQRAKALWNISRTAGMFGINLLIWGHVLVGLWSIFFR